MLEQLKMTMSYLSPLLNQPERWDSLIVNRRKPHTYRVFTYFRQKNPLVPEFRVCLHKFESCHDHEAFLHPHPWPGAFLILSGRYKMNIGLAPNKTDRPQNVSTFELCKDSMYEITNPLTFHSVIPLETTYTIMINNEPWPETIVHKEVRTTKGKDLDKMPQDELLKHLQIYKSLVHDWLISNE
jgi:hypothetical protein